MKSVFQNHSETSPGARYFIYYSLDSTYIWWQWTETEYDKVRSGLDLFGKKKKSDLKIKIMVFW